MSPQATDERATLFRGVADRNRLRIIEQLCTGEQRVTDVARATRLAQPNVSAHLACLHECGLVDRERRGREVRYRLADGVPELLTAADAILAVAGERVDACPNYGRGRREVAA